MISLQIINAASPFFLLIMKTLNEKMKDAYDYYFDRLKDRDLSDFLAIIETKIGEGTASIEPKLVCVAEHKVAYKELARRAVELAPPGARLVIKGNDLDLVYKKVARALIRQRLTNVFKLNKIQKETNKGYLPPTIDIVTTD